VNQSIAHVALVVHDYDEAIQFFTKRLKFALIEDTYVPEQDQRWVVVAPNGSGGTKNERSTNSLKHLRKADSY